MFINLGIVVALAALTYLILFRRHAARGPSSHAGARMATHGPEARSSTTQPAPPARSHHAVAVVTGRRPCAAAAELSDQRFLSAEAPTLPLEACDRSRCECRYQHFADRRQDDDRRMPYGNFHDLGISDDRTDRRHRGDRRRG